jgi:ribose transport system ATP-binding protein
MAGRNEGELEEEIKTGERSQSEIVSSTSQDPSQAKANRVELLKVEGLQGGRIESADLTVYSGEIVGITGLLGSGYEDVPYLLCGSQPKQAGSVVVDGTVLQKANPRTFKSLGAVLLPGDRQLTSGIQAASVRENMTMGYLAPFSRKGILNHRSERDVVSKMMGKLRIRPQNPERPLNEFSGGQQQKALIGRCLLRSAKLIVIDEPCTGIDVGARDEIHRTLREVATGGSSVLIDSCQYEELTMKCDRVVVFQGGRIVGELAGQEVTEEAILRLCYTDSPAVSI